MKSFSRKEIDLSEEISANRLFITLFYLTIVSYDTFRFFIDPEVIIGTKSLFFDSLAYTIVTSVIYFCRNNASALRYISHERTSTVRY